MHDEILGQINKHLELHFLRTNDYGTWMLLECTFLFSDNSGMRNPVACGVQVTWGSLSQKSTEEGPEGILLFKRKPKITKTSSNMKQTLP